MLTNEDVQWIRQNREDITQNREKTVTLIGVTQSGFDPITDEPITSETNMGDYRVLWDVPSTKHQDHLMIEGIEIETTDRYVKFRDTVDLDAVKYVIHAGEKYRIITIDPRGIGEFPNRFECLVRLVL